MMKCISNTAIACISFVLLTLCSCDASDFSNEYARFTQSETQYKLFLEFNSGSLTNQEAQDLQKAFYKFNQNEYKDISEIYKVREILKQEVNRTKGSTQKKDYSIRCVVRDRDGKTIEVLSIIPDL